MKKYLILSSALAFQLMGQNSASTSGGKLYGLNFQLDYNVGQTFSGYSKSTTASVVTGTLQPKFSILTSVNQSTIDYGLQVYPNPTKDVVNLDGNEMFNLEIIDVEGKIQKTELATNKVDMSVFAQGIYVLKIYNQKSELINTTKIIKN